MFTASKTYDPRSSLPGVRAAQYLRMSTDHQDISIEMQQTANLAYAQACGITIVRSYSDLGISGLHFDRRPGLVSLIADITGTRAEFSVVLVRDVSRWGRFQDTDEGAYYEYVCRQHGVEILYTAEPLVNSRDAYGTIIKSIKRVMAAEFSRELSGRVVAAKTIVAQQGYRVGGHPGLGLRRMRVDRAGNPKGIIQPGEKKANQSDRVILVPGPKAEVKAVRQTFSDYVKLDASMYDLADHLTEQGFRSPNGKDISRLYVRNMLTNRKYIGEAIYGRISNRIGQQRQDIPPENWVVVDNAFEPIVSRKLFEEAYQKARSRKSPICASNEQMLALLRRLWEEKGYISESLVNEAEYTPNSSTYVKRFGSLRTAYELVGYDRERNIVYAINETRNKKRFCFAGYNRISKEEMVKRLKKLLGEKGRLSAHLINECVYVPSSNVIQKSFGSLVTAYEQVGYQPGKRAIALSKENSLRRE